MAALNTVPLPENPQEIPGGVKTDSTPLECSIVSKEEATPDVAAEAPAKPIPTFPKSAMIGSLGDLARILGEGTEIPEEFIFAAALTYFGAIASGELTLHDTDGSDTRLFTILLGESASAKKSSAWRKADDFFKSLHVSKTGSWRTLGGACSAEGLIAAFNDEEDGVAKVVLTYDELRSLLDKGAIKGSILTNLVAELFERTKYSSRTKKTKVNLTNARLSIVACCTIQTFEDIWSTDALSLGLDNRFFVVTAADKPPVARRRPPDPLKLAEIKDRIGRQLSKAYSQKKMTPLADKLWEEWYLRMKELPEKDHIRRLDTIGLRLMPILAHTCDKAEVDEEIVRCVIDILEYEYEVRKLYSPIDASSDIAKLEGKIKKHLASRKELSKRDLYRAVNAQRNGEWMFKNALENLVRAKVIEGIPAVEPNRYKWIG